MARSGSPAAPNRLALDLRDSTLAVSPLTGTLPHCREGSPRSGGWGTSAPVGDSPDEWGDRDPPALNRPGQSDGSLVNDSQGQAHCRRRREAWSAGPTIGPRSQVRTQPKESAPNPAADPIDSQNSRRIPVSRTAKRPAKPAAEGRPLLRDLARTPSRNGSAANNPTRTQHASDSGTPRTSWEGA